MCRKYIFLLFVILTFSLVVTIHDSEASDAETIVDEGTYENLYWKISESGTLSIECINVNLDTTILDEFHTAPWNTYKYIITKIKICDGISQLRECTFQGYPQLTSIELPESLEVIGASCFADCRFLGSVQFPMSLKEIQDYAFSGCQAIRSINLPQNVTYVGGATFSNCRNLEEVSWSQYANVIDYQTFYECDSLTTLTNIEKVSSVKEQAFHGCDSLKSVSFSEELSEIGDYCFSYCENLTDVNLGSITAISEYSFMGCTKLSSVSGISDITLVDQGAFEGCLALKYLEFGNKVNIISISAFNGCRNLEKITGLGKNLMIGDSAFISCEKLTSVGTDGPIMMISGSSFENCHSLKNIDLNPNIKTIPTHAFSNCYALTEFNFTENLVSIEDYAFSGCSSIKTIELHNQITTIGQNAFYGCSAIESLYYDVPNIQLNSSVFAYLGASVNIQYVEFGENVESIPYNLFLLEHKIVVNKMVVGSKVTNLNVNCFDNLIINKLEISDLNPYFITIDGMVFNKSLTDLLFCISGLNTQILYIPENVTKICSYAFKGTEYIRQVQIPDSVKIIESCSFAYSSIETLEIPDDILLLENNSLAYCNNLKTLYFPIDRDLISALGAVDLLQQWYTEDCEYNWAFANWPYGTGFDQEPPTDYRITISELVFTPGKTGIGFDYSNEIVEIYWENTHDMNWETGDYYTKDIHTSGPKGSFGPWRYGSVNIAIKEGVKSIGDNNYIQGTVSLPSSLMKIGDNAFRGHIIGSLKNVLYIGDDSFRNCSFEESLDLSNVKSIGANAFNGCSPVDSITLADSITTIGSNAFKFNHNGDVQIVVYAPESISLDEFDNCFIYANRSYTITYRVDGEIYHTDVLKFGTIINLPQNPTKGPENGTAYSFLRWSGYTKDMTMRGDTTFDAIFESYPDGSYHINFYSEGELFKTLYVMPGSTIPYPGEATKEPTKEHSYVFSNWSGYSNGMIADTDMSFYAIFNTEMRLYALIYKSEGTIVDTLYQTYGNIVISTDTIPTKAEDENYRYVFDHWDGFDEEIIVRGDITFNAIFTLLPKKSIITFISEGQTVISRVVEFGSKIESPEITPMKKSDVQYSYEFVSWEGFEENMVATGTHTFYAVYEKSLRYYDITFNVDGKLYQKKNLAYGTTIDTPATNPTKEDTAQYKYIFLNWEGYQYDQTVSGNKTYEAIFTTLTREYTVVFSNDDTIVQFQTLKYGTLIESPGKVTKNSTAKYDYSFDEWSGYSEGMIVTDSIVFYASFVELIRSYTVTWLHEDGTPLLVEKNVPYGTLPMYSGQSPTKTPGKQYTYEFYGWSPSVSSVTGDISYTAVFEKILNSYTITWTDDAGNTLEINHNVSYGSMPSFNGATPTKVATEQYRYTFAGWSPAVETVSGDARYSAVFVASLNTYSVTWKDSAGLILQYTSEVPYGTVPSYNGAAPLKMSDAQYSYTFSGWSPNVTAVVSDVVYTAQFIPSVRTYSVTWINDDGSILKIESDLDYGFVPEYSGATPVKEATAQYTYSFKCWSPAIVSVTGDDVYTAVYDSHLNSYEITWKNDDGTVLEKSTAFYGVSPSYSGSTPTKSGTDSSTYVFKGWAPVVLPVTGDATYVATYAVNKTTYTVTWVNDNGSILAIDYDVEYGTIPSFKGNTPIKNATQQYAYRFTGWSPAIEEVTENAVYVATYDSELLQYNIIWKNYDGSILESDIVSYGSSPKYDGQIPIKSSTAQYSYTFAGWNNDLEIVKTDKVYTAVFDSTVNSYNIVWKNGDSLLYSAVVEYGSTPAYNGPVPSKDADGENNYIFAGWSPEIENVTKNAEYQALFTSSKISYIITWKDDAGKIIHIDYDAEYGKTPAYTGTEPSKKTTDQFTYSFTGWYPAVSPVTQNATYVATFDSTVNSYKVVWKNFDGSILETDEVLYGVTPSFNGKEPTRIADVQYTYAFAGWDVEPVAVSKDSTYTATFEKTVNMYDVVWKNGDVILYSTKLAYGTLPAYNGDVPVKLSENGFEYSFKGWSTEIQAVTKNVEYVAQFVASKLTYNITWKNDDGTVLSIDYDVEYGSVPAFSGSSPVKKSDEQYSYTFTGWSTELVPVTCHTEYVATFEPILRTYSIIWKNADGSILETDLAAYGSSPKYDGVSPAKAPTAQYSYTFAGWDSDLEIVKADKTYTAVFDRSVNTYAVTWKNGETVINTVTLEYGDLPAYNGAVPVQEPNGTYTYEFAGWSPAITNVVGDATYTAVFNAHKALYTITWKDDSGAILDVSYDVEYGTVPAYAGTTPVKTSDARYSYDFAGWTPFVSEVIGDITYTAVYSKTFLNYTVAFLNEDGSILQIDRNAHYGDAIGYTGDTPQKKPSSYFEYSFLRWNGFLEGMTVNGDITFAAVYEERQVFFPITFIQYNGEKTTLLYRHGDTYVEEPDPYFGTPAGCIAFWEPYVLDETIDNTVHVRIESYLDYEYVDAPVVTTNNGVLNAPLGNQVLAVVGTNSNLDRLYEHQGSNYRIEVPSTTLDGVTIGAISSLNDKSVTNITFGENIRYIMDGAFNECDSLASFEVTGGNHYKSVGGALLNYSGETLICLPSVGESYAIPETVKEILAAAIQGNISVLYIDANNGVLLFANGANASGNDIQLRASTETTELSVATLAANCSEMSLEVIPHDLYGDQTGDTIYVIIAVAILAIVMQFLAAYRPQVIGNRHTWMFIAPLSLSAFAMFVYSILETVGHDTDTFFTVLMAVWFVAGAMTTAVTLRVYITTNRSRNESIIDSRWRKIIFVSSMISTVGCIMVIAAIFGDVARISEIMAPQLIVLSVLVALADVLAIIASKKIFSEVKHEQEHFSLTE